MYLSGIHINRGDARDILLGKVKRGLYPFSMYRQKASIGGLREDKDLADRVLKWNNLEMRTIAMWTIGRQDRLYDQCNCKNDADAEYNFKFCEKYDVLMARNIRTFAVDFGVKRVLFPED
jgi:hypothetical protein